MNVTIEDYTRMFEFIYIYKSQNKIKNIAIPILSSFHPEYKRENEIIKRFTTKIKIHSS